MSCLFAATLDKLCDPSRSHSVNSALKLWHHECAVRCDARSCSSLQHLINENTHENAFQMNIFYLSHNGPTRWFCDRDPHTFSFTN